MTKPFEGDPKAALEGSPEAAEQVGVLAINGAGGTPADNKRAYPIQDPPGGFTNTLAPQTPPNAMRPLDPVVVIRDPDPIILADPGPQAYRTAAGALQQRFK